MGTTTFPGRVKKSLPNNLPINIICFFSLQNPGNSIKTAFMVSYKILHRVHSYSGCFRQGKSVISCADWRECNGSDFIQKCLFHHARIALPKNLFISFIVSIPVFPNYMDDEIIGKVISSCHFCISRLTRAQLMKLLKQAITCGRIGIAVETSLPRLEKFVGGNDQSGKPFSVSIFPWIVSKIQDGARAASSLIVIPTPIIGVLIFMESMWMFFLKSAMFSSPSIW